MADLSAWLAERATLDDQLYERYGKPLEHDCTGQYVAIGPSGQPVVGPTAAEVLRQAVDSFGSGNFALKRVGHSAFGSRATLRVL